MLEQLNMSTQYNHPLALLAQCFKCKRVLRQTRVDEVPLLWAGQSIINLDADYDDEAACEFGVDEVDLQAIEGVLKMDESQYLDPGIKDQLTHYLKQQRRIKSKQAVMSGLNLTPDTIAKNLLSCMRVVKNEAALAKLLDTNMYPDTAMEADDQQRSALPSVPQDSPDEATDQDDCTVPLIHQAVHERTAAPYI